MNTRHRARWIMILSVSVTAGCVTQKGPALRTGWIREILPGSAVMRLNAAAPGSIACAKGKSEQEIESTNWAVVGVAHVRSLRNQTLPLNAQFVPAVGARVLTEVSGCHVLPTR